MNESKNIHNLLELADSGVQDFDDTSKEHSP
jgi:hypothetical protein